jgi:hypothetical protein
MKALYQVAKIEIQNPSLRIRRQYSLKLFPPQVQHDTEQLASQIILTKTESLPKQRIGKLVSVAFSTIEYSPGLLHG